MGSAVLYLSILVVLCASGLPLGFRLFGRQQAAGWIAGGLFGYVLTCLAAWIAMRAGSSFLLVAVGAWLALGAVSFVLVRWRDAPLIELPAWTRRDSGVLTAVLLSAAVLTVIPLRRVGERDPQGNVRYRAYFTADFLWHTALTAELTTGTLPPRNPYYGSHPVHYYWTYFLVPAAIARAGPPPLRDVQACLKGNALGCGLLFVGAIFISAFVACRRAFAAATATLLAILASSAEGAYEMWHLWQRGRPWSGLRGINVDALTAWYFGGHRIDGLQRCLWYVPQHSTAYALGLIALTTAIASPASGSPAIIAFAGFALAGSVIMNPFVGGLFALAWGLAETLNLAAAGRLRVVVRYSVAIVPVALGIGWCIANRMVEGAGGALVFGWGGASQHAPVWNLLLSLGPALAPAIMLLVFRPTRVDVGRLLPPIVLAAISLAIMHLVRLSVDEPWVPFRAGQMLLVSLPALVGCALVRSFPKTSWRGVMAAVVIASAIVGLPTTAIDVVNAQDTDESGSGAGFHWTLVLNRQEQEALAWIRKSTPRTAIVQMEPMLRDRDRSPGGWGEYWSLIPSLAERRMAAGLPISLLRVPEYESDSEQVRRMYEMADPHDARALARALRIDYVYVDGKDREAYPGARKFDDSPDQFEPVFKLLDAGVYRVR